MRFTISSEWDGERYRRYDAYSPSGYSSSDDDDDYSDDETYFAFEGETHWGYRKGDRITKWDLEQDRIEQETNRWLASMEFDDDDEEEVPSSWGHGGSHRRNSSPEKKAARATRRKAFADKLQNFTKRALIQDAKLIVGAMKRNVRTLARSRHPFVNYVTARRESNWKKSFAYEVHDNNVIVGVNKTKKGSLNEIFEHGGDIEWTFSSLYRDRTKTEKKAIFKKFLNHSPTYKSCIKKVPRIGDLKLDMTAGPAQPYLKALKAMMKPLRAKIADEERERFWYAKNRKNVHYPFVEKSQYEISGLLAIPPRKLLTGLKTTGQNSTFHLGLLDMTQKELEKFCQTQNQLNKRRRNVKRNSIPNLRPEQLSGLIGRVSWRKPK